MPTAQGDIQVDEEFKPEPGQRRGLYLTIACQDCSARRTFRASDILSRILHRKSDGYLISIFCDQCGRGIVVQLFTGRQALEEFEDAPIFPEAGDLRMDPEGLQRWPPRREFR